MKGQTVKILEPIAVIAQVVKLKPAGGGFIEINDVLGLSLSTLFLPPPCKIAAVKHQTVCLRPLPKRCFFKRPNNPVYREVTGSPVCGSLFRRKLPCLIRSYCFMASSSDAFGCCDTRSFNRLLRWRW